MSISEASKLAHVNLFFKKKQCRNRLDIIVVTKTTNSTIN
ncbi:hypothetical protein rpr22_0486 [Rickettsia prowazekii str. Rp22]|uniref:Uncharacterized protein n=1 Tax=Rickettsia prowazekii (strain Rp22) TaxID=449216 RepID=D5AX50_RICPP|nr:hypothetical protein rpr22_0486 [Rickettsia prowazekii str. Rp22]AGJ02377.1 hypothetical protein H375_1510 [Rickettsia prowazekii str. Breinl]EOB10575.1 hypothetical protein H377_5490 [Rickettsia prowazekii str. Cairo 3]